MVDPTLKIQASDVVGSSSSRAGSTRTTAVAFQALLERLDTQARELRNEAGKVENTGDLSQAVDRAHDSLREALSLGERIVEAYRESLTRSSGESTGRTT